MVSLLSPANASVTRPVGLSAVRVHVTPDCSVPLAAPLPATPSLEADCPGPAASSGPQAFSPHGSAPAPCTSVVPLVDNRCELWTARYNGPVGGPDQPNGELGGARLLAVSPDSKTVFAAGLSDSNPSTASGWAGLDMDLVIAAYDTATGDPKWPPFRFPHSDQTYAHNIVADPDGDLVYVTSQDYEEIGECVRHPSTVAVDQATGTLAWSERESTPDQGCIDAESSVVDPTGERLFIVAGAEGGDGRLEQTLIARDADTGELLWRAAGTSGAGETGSVVAVSADGETVYAGGSKLGLDTYGFPMHVAWVIRGYDTVTGEQVFSTTWNSPLPSAFSSAMNPPAGLAISPDGSRVYVVGGADHVPGRFFDITAVALDTTTGEQRWLYRYDGPRSKSSFDSVWYNGAAALSTDGSKLAIAGYSTHLIGVNLQFDLATVLVDTATGQGLWASRYTAENETNWIPSAAISPDGSKVYVAAPSRYAFNADLPARYTSLAYNAADGSVAWTARHSDGHSFAMGSALTPNGKHFVVTGMTGTAGAETLGDVNWDIGLAAYSTA